MKPLVTYWNATPISAVAPHYLLLWVSALILAYEPVRWLVHTWMDPSYDSKGFFVFALCATLFTWSMTSPKVTCRPNDKKKPYALLGGSAVVRLIGQVAAVNVIGALTLIIDVYALCKIAAVENRKRALSPLWLALCFAFSLPLERIIQRTIGYMLQGFSAAGACRILGVFHDNVVCHGVRILINARDVMVDLPCSGARSVLLLLFFYCACAALSRFNVRVAIAGLFVALLSALLMNMLRICLLSVGLAYPVFGIDVMAQPWHDLIGLMTLGLGCLPVVWWGRQFYVPQKELPPVLDRACFLVPESLKKDGWWLQDTQKTKDKMPYVRVGAAISFVFLALFITAMPRTALDVVRKDLPLSLPYSLNGIVGISIPLRSAEAQYFTQYGGSAEKRQYGSHGLMMVRTSAPLRHLHAPDACLRGLGMTVEYKGVDYSSIPSAIYKATDQTGAAYRIAVSFIPEDKSHITPNVSEAVWHWLQKPGQSWMAVQRISPWDTPFESNQRFDQAFIAALDLDPDNSPILIAHSGVKL